METPDVKDENIMIPLKNYLKEKGGSICGDACAARIPTYTPLISTSNCFDRVIL
jgi:hypothetical protein